MTTIRVSAELTAAIACATLRPWCPLMWRSAMCPATIVAISAPNSRLSSASVHGVYSTVSCNIAAHSVWLSAPSPARIVATAAGWVMYGSPLRRVWSLWQCAATS